MSRSRSVSIDDEVYSKASSILADLGLTFSAAVEVFARAVVRERGIPFEVSLERGREGDPDD